MLKLCTKCQQELPIGNFTKNRVNKDGLQTYCRDCNRGYYHRNKEKYLARDHEYHKRNKSKNNQRSRDYYKVNREVLLAKKKDYGKVNLSKILARNSYRRAYLSKATPPWLTPEHKAQIESFYDLARDAYLVSGQAYHVDHIVPLKGSNVCGLHVPWNLQVLPSDLNLKKYNL